MPYPAKHSARLIESSAAEDNAKDDLESKVIKFIKDNPKPKDEKVHSFAEKLGINPDKLEEIIYKLLSEFLDEGLSKGKDGNFDKQVLEKGIKVEMEHTTNKYLSEKIAKDHLTEDPKYYEKLAKMEKQNSKEMPKVFYCKHIQAGVARYENEMILIENEALKKMMPTMAGIPVYVEHRPVDLEKIQEEADGYVSECFYNENDGWFWAKFIVVSDEGQEAVRKGWSVSNAYLPIQSGDGGVWHNVDYDREILNAEYSHLAIVPNPRYEGALIMTSEEYKGYNNYLENQIKELTNSKENKKQSGGLKMKFFKTKKEVIENADDISIQLENGKVVSLSEMVNAVEDEEKKEEEKVNEDSVIKVGGKEMSIKELKNKYNEIMKKQAKNNTEEEEEEEEEEDNKKNKKNSYKKNESDEDEEKEKENEDEEKKEEEKKNSKYFYEMKNSIEKDKGLKLNYETRDVKLARGKERY